MKGRNIQPFALKEGDWINNQPSDNVPKAKLKYLYNVAKYTWMLKYGTEKFFTSRHELCLDGIMGYLQGISWKHHQINICENKYTPLIPPDLTINTQACAASIQVFSGSKAEEINEISHHTVATIEIQLTRTDDPMVVLQAKGSQKSSRKISLWATEYGNVSRISVIPIQETKKECMMILQQKRWYW